MTTVRISPQAANSDFETIARSFVVGEGLPFASVLPPKEIGAIFRRHEALFGQTYNAIYTTAIVLWAFLSQVLADGKLRSCSTAVGRVRDFFIALGQTPPSTDTGEYCHARRKLNEKALYDLMAEVASKVQQLAPQDWLWYGRHVKLVDGFTATMSDTPENQEAFPQPKSQKPGVGFPIMRACVIISLATACIMDAAFGTYSGKQTGEPALLGRNVGFVPVGRRSCFRPVPQFVYDVCLVGPSGCGRLRAVAPAAAG